MHADPALVRSVRAHVSDAEWAVRTDLAAAYRAVAFYGWDDLVFTHLSARVPGPEHHFLINPYGMMFEEITASSLVKVDLAGAKAMESPSKVVLRQSGGMIAWPGIMRKLDRLDPSWRD